MTKPTQLENSAQLRTSDARQGPGRLLTYVLLALVVLIGGYFRFVGLNWDDFSAMHPDERFLTLNTLPLIGGALEFTVDNERFPPQSLLVSEGNPADNRLALLDNPATRIGVLEDTLAEDLATWEFGPDRVVVYLTREDAQRALQSGVITGLMVPETEATAYLPPAGAARSLESYSSQTIQSLRCRHLYPNTGGVGTYFDTLCSPWNPHNSGAGFFAYGTLPILMAHFTGDFVWQQDLAGSTFFDFQGWPLVWRFWSAFFDVGTILVVFFTAARMHNRWTGLMAALLYAAAPLAIQKAHFGTVNAITAFFVALALWAAVGVQDRGRWWYYGVFGFAFGAAMAGRINILPLAGVVVLAALVHCWPALNLTDDRSPAQRRRLLLHSALGLIFAGIASVVVFRVTNPHAFMGPGLLTFSINPRWLADMASASYGVSGQMDAAPNWQWVGRASYFYPLKDMVLWGMGIAMGAMAWFGFGWSGFRLLRGVPAAVRNILPFVWVLVYFAWIGRLWVMTMRYYLPLYSALAILAAWALYELWRQSRSRDLPLLRGVLIALGVVLALIPGYYLSSGHPLTFTAVFAAVVAAVLLVVAVLPGIPRWRARTLTAFVLGFTVLWGLMFTSIYRQQLTRVQGALWLWENVSGDFSMQIEGAPEGTPLINIALPNARPESSDDPEALLTAATRLTPLTPQFVEFVAPASGTVTHIYAPHLGDPLDTPEPEVLNISIARPGAEVPLAVATLSQNLPRESHILGESYRIPLTPQLQVTEGETYQLKVESTAGTIMVAGSVVVTESPWDDRLTEIKVCTLPPGVSLVDNPPSGLLGYDDCRQRETWRGLLQSYDADLSYPIDEPIKRDLLLNALEVGDYIAISSNRFYDTVTRNRLRWPMTSRYYEALFGGELGFDLVQVRHAGFELGPLSVSDQHLPIYESPQWLNELEADEAFHVYDHQAVFVFKKRADYDHNRARLILSEVPLTRPEMTHLEAGESGAAIANVAYWTSLQADEAPNALMMTPEDRVLNRVGGTWSERFDSDSLLNTNQIAGAVVWWGVIMLFGFLAWPLLFFAFPRMADRGYGFAKLTGLLLVAWAAWVGGTLHLTTWSQMGILLLLVLMGALSTMIVWRQRQTIGAYLRANWRRLLTIEVLTLVLFVAFIGVRLTNPDLWHFSKGGEKPMDFAYFNAVLRTTVFPAYDPWFAGGTINYYYFGFVLVGSPVLLLKMVPAFAYNLIIPTLFALTGMGAFSVAFNIVAAWRERSGGGQQPAHRLGSPWVAGIAALVLAVVVGNLDTIRVLGMELARIGGYDMPTSLEQSLRDEYNEQFAITDPSGFVILPPEREQELSARLSNLTVFDRIGYEIGHAADLLGSVVRGAQMTLSGQPVWIRGDRWYWGPSRVLQEPPVSSGNAITEMPYFTFLYGDLHAHMINLPVILFALLFVFNEVVSASEDRRRAVARVLAVFLGALAIGLMTAINTWDWPSFMIFGVIGLGYAWWLRWRTLSLPALAEMLLYVGGFIVIAYAVALPHTSYYAATYQSVELYQDHKTPLWAYFDIHGLFLFLIVSLLAWETGRWLRSVKVKALRGQGHWLSLGALIAGLVTVLTIAAALVEYQVALFVVPLILWIVPLFFRPDQSPVLQYVLVMIGFGLALTLGVEIVTISGDIGRQNTVFKFYMQVWLLFSVAGGAAFAWLLASSDHWMPRLRALWFTPLIVMFVIAALFPILGTRARALDRYQPSSGLVHDPVMPGETIESLADQYNVTSAWLRAINGLNADGQPQPDQALTVVPVGEETDPVTTLDGLAYMRYAVHAPFDTINTLIALEHDYNIIRWLQENVEGSPVIMEGRSPASEYRWTSRIAINTGLPSVLGWRFHQTQQRTFDPLPSMVVQREDNVKYFYNTTDIAGAVRILRHYDVRYVIVSGFERVWTSPEGLAKFDLMTEMGLLELVYTDGVGRVYEIQHDELDDFVLTHLAFGEAIRQAPATTEAAERLVTRAAEALARYDYPYLAVRPADSATARPELLFYLERLVERGDLALWEQLIPAVPADAAQDVRLSAENDRLVVYQIQAGSRTTD